MPTMTDSSQSMIWLTEVAGASFIGGILGSISGLGGGIVIVPVLTILMHIPIEQAIAASIVSVIAVSSGAGSVYVKDRITNVRIAMFLEVSTAAGALVGAGYLAGHINANALYILFARVAPAGVADPDLSENSARNCRRIFTTTAWRRHFG